MKKNVKKILTTSLIASFALTTALGVSVFAMPKAEADFSDFTMDTGAGVRMDTPTGIRFTANVGEKTRASLENATNVTFGMLIAPNMGDDGVLTLDDVTDDSIKAKNLVTAVWSDGATSYAETTSYKYNGAIVGGETVDFPKDKYATALNAVGYVTYTIDDVTTTEYTTSTANRSLAQAASNSLANGIADPNGVLSGIVSEVVDSVSFADETIEMTLNATKVESATVSASADVDTSVLTVTYQSNNPSVATVDIYGNVTAKSEGNATITATVGNATDTLDVVVEGSTTLLNDCAAVGSVGRTAWGWPTTTTSNDSLTTVETSAPVGVPAKYAGSSTNSNYTSQQAMVNSGHTDGRAVPAFEISSFFNNIESYDDKDYIGIWVYVEATSDALWDSYFTVSKGVPHSANSAYTATNQKQFPYADKIPTNTWTMLKIPVSSIRTAMATNTNVDAYDTLVLDLRFGGNTGKVYYYAVDVYPWELLNDCADTATVTDTTWNNGNAPQTMAVSEVGYPDASVYTGNAISKNVMKQKIHMGGNLCQSYTAFKLPTLFDNIADMDMNDYIGIWMYYQSTSDTMIDSVLAYTSVGRPFTSYTSCGTTANNSNCLPTNQWVMVKIGVDEIRASMSKNATLAFDTLSIEVRSTKYTSSAEYVYFYSVDAYEVEDNGIFALNTCDSTSKTSMSAWNNTNSNAVVSTAPVGVPTDYAGAKTGTNYIEQTIFVKSQNKLAQHIPTFSIPTLCGNLAYLEDTDYLGLWVYAEAPEGTTTSQQLFVGLSTELTAPNNATSSAGTYKQTALSEQVATNTWTMIKIPISTIRSLVDANPSIAFTFLYIDYRVNTVYYDSAESEKMYLYALDLYTGA